MNRKRPHEFAQFEDELVRLACDEGAAADASAETHVALQISGALRAELDEMRELVRDLRGALRPEPVSPELLSRIHARLDNQTRETRMLRLPRSGVVGLSAAAALVLAALGPLTMPPAANVPGPTVTLSPADATDIVAACSVLGWSGQVDDSLQHARDVLDTLEQQIEGRQEARTGLPWGPAEDWDVPTKDDTLGTPRPAPWREGVNLNVAARASAPLDRSS